MPRAIGFCLACLLITTRAGAGNQDSFVLGNEAALNGGAVAATSHGPETVWYNPAGLAGTNQSSLDLTATAFALRRRRIPGGSALFLQDGSQVSEELTSTRVLVVPTSLALGRRLGDDLMFGAGVFVPELDQWRFEQKLGELSTRDGSRLRQRVDIQGTRYRYNGGASLAWAVTPRYRVGVSLLAAYETFDQVARFWWSIQRQDEPASVLLGEERRSVTRHSADSILSLQAELSENVHLGFVLRAPGLLLRQTVQGDNISSGAFGEGRAGAPPELVFAFEDVEDTYRAPGLLSPVSPPRAVLALAYDWGRATTSAEVDVSPSLDNRRAGLQAERVVNVRLGGSYRWDRDLTLGAGVFTDRSSSGPLSGFPWFRVHYYGGQVGVKLGKFLKLEDESRDELLFETTLALRYALGVGQASALSFDFSDLDRGDFDVAAARKTDVSFHELSLHVGTGLAF